MHSVECSACSDYLLYRMYCHVSLAGVTPCLTCVNVGWIHTAVRRRSRKPRWRCQVLARQRRWSDTCYAGILPHILTLLALSFCDPLQDNAQQDIVILYVLLLLLLLHTGWFHVVVSPLWMLSAMSSLVFLSFSCPPPTKINRKLFCTENKKPKLLTVCHIIFM